LFQSQGSQLLGPLGTSREIVCDCFSQRSNFFVESLGLFDPFFECQDFMPQTQVGLPLLASGVSLRSHALKKEDSRPTQGEDEKGQRKVKDSGSVHSEVLSFSGSR
jgi:hypothetical protein